MEDFFKNKLNDFDASTDGWDKPDGAVWEAAQRQFPQYPPKRIVDWKIWTVTLMGLVILLLGGYLVYMSQQLDLLGNSLETANTQLETANRKLSSFQKTSLDEKTKLFEYQEEVNADNEKVLEQNQHYASIVQKQKEEIQFLRKEYKKAASVLEQESSTVGENKNTITSEDFTNDEVRLEDAYTSETTKNFVEEKAQNVTNVLIENDQSPNELISLIIDPLRLLLFPTITENPNQELQFPVTPVKRPRVRFEIGLSYSNLKLEVPMQSTFDKLKSISKDNINTSYTTDAKGIHLAIGIKPNLFITTGIRKAHLFVKFPVSSGLVYDKSGEYLDTNGKKSNNLVLTTETPYDEVRDEIRIILPEDSNPSNGDILLSDLYKLNDFTYNRIPLGLEYFTGKNKLQWLLKGGMAWNSVRLESQLVDGSLFFKDKIIAIAETDKVGINKIKNQFFSAYLGGGCDYRFANRWHARAALLFERNISSTGISSGKLDFDRSLKMSLNFRF